MLRAEVGAHQGTAMRNQTVGGGGGDKQVQRRFGVGSSLCVCKAPASYHKYTILADTPQGTRPRLALLVGP